MAASDLEQHSLGCHSIQEAAEGKLLVDAAKNANVKLLVWSGLPSLTHDSGGRFVNAYLCDDKAEVTEYAESVGIPFVNVQAGGYMQNYLTHNRPQKQADGSFAIFSAAAPDLPFPLIDTNNDYGLFVRKAIEQSVKLGTEMYAGTDMKSFNDIARILGEGTCHAFLSCALKLNGYSY